MIPGIVRNTVTICARTHVTRRNGTVLKNSPCAWYLFPRMHRVTTGLRYTRNRYVPDVGPREAWIHWALVLAVM